MIGNFVEENFKLCVVIDSLFDIVLVNVNLYMVILVDQGLLVDIGDIQVWGNMLGVL